MSNIAADFTTVINELKLNDVGNAVKYDVMLNSVFENSSFSDIINLLETERAENTKLRLAHSFPDAHELILQQQKDVDSCFCEVNYLLAELAELCADENRYTVEKINISGRLKGSLKELAAQKRYAVHIMKTTLENCKETNSIFSEASFKSRIHNNLRIKHHYKTILKDPPKISFITHKKYEWKYARAKAIMRADIKAFKTAWPNSDYIFLAFIDSL
jgi:hypothetical protein